MNGNLQNLKTLSIKLTLSQIRSVTTVKITTYLNILVYKCRFFHTEYYY